MESRKERSAADGIGIRPLARPTPLRSTALRGAKVAGSKAEKNFPLGDTVGSSLLSGRQAPRGHGLTLVGRWS